MGTGTSVGVPVVGCRCTVCLSENSRNRRTRSGVLARAPAGEFVIDTGPELRLQLLASRATMIRAAIFTHAHADHVMGLDDLRIFGFRLEKELARKSAGTAGAADGGSSAPAAADRARGSIPLYCEESVEDAIRRIFFYAFSDPSTHSHQFAAPRLRFEPVIPGVRFELLGLTVTPIRLQHGSLPILGYRIGDVAFCTDVSDIPVESCEQLQGLDTLIIDALRYHAHPTHLTVNQALKWVQRLRPRRAVLTHMSHDLEYEKLRQELPEGVEPGYDGMVIPLAGALPD